MNYATRSRREVTRALVCALLLLAPSSLRAQQIVNPSIAEFDPSVDHEATSNGAALVSRYDLEFFMVGAAEPFQTVSLGKPAGEPDGKIRVNFVSLLGALPTAGIAYESAVAAVGPGGTSRSARSNTFSFSTPCSYSVSSPTQPAAASGGTLSVAVTAGSGCSWTATEGSTWLAITNGASGNGNGTVTFTVAANTSSSARTANLSVAGETVPITQSGCTYAVSPTGRSLSSDAGSSTFSVTTSTGCSWTATDNRSWINISGASGSGSRNVTFSVTANGSDFPRTGTITVAGQTIAIEQAGDQAAPAPPSNVRVVSS